MISEIYDYIDADFKIFGLHGSTNGACNCGDVDCKAVLKHPIMSNWQSVPNWSDEQLECFDMMGHFNTGFGVLCKGWLVVDVDARNDGVKSFKQLCKDVPSVADAKFIVNTGSGGGSQHHYFKLTDDQKSLSLLQSLPKYKGIDFKTSGYVVGSGSLHNSGANYETVTGYPQDIDFAPTELIDLLTRPTFFRVSNQGLDIDIDEQHIVDLLAFVSPDCGYQEWISIGMAIHHCLTGGGLELWDNWSSKGKSYNGLNDLQKHWHSFGKTANPVGYGTLLHYAKEGGYCEPVTFVYNNDFVIDDNNVNDAPLNCPSLDMPVDLKRPPDFVGELTQWINDQCLYPRENLAVAAALCAVSSLAGMRYIDELDGMSANILAFCVAGAGSGKEAIMQSYIEIMRTAGISSAVHGGFKSEQEIMRNLIRHQAAFYCVDELGLILGKLANASKKGGASYLEGIVGLIMSVYSKANGFLPITGDLKEDIKQKLIAELLQLEKRMEKLPEDSSSDDKRQRLEDACKELSAALKNVDNGLENPYLSLLGFTTPVTFNELMTFEQATNGFMARAMIFDEKETNPKRKSKFRKMQMSDSMANSLRNLYSHGSYDMMSENARVQFVGDKCHIPTDECGQHLLNEVYERFYQLAETHKATTGLEAIARRGYEIASKVSLICALPSGLRTGEHVRFGYALAMRDVDNKIKLAYSTDNKKSADGLAAKVLSILDNEHGETLGVICNRLRGTPKAQVESLLEQMTTNKLIKSEEYTKSNDGRKVKRFYAL